MARKQVRMVIRKVDRGYALFVKGNQFGRARPTRAAAARARESFFKRTG